MRKEWGGWIKNRQWDHFEKEAREEPSQILANTVAELSKGFDSKSDKRALKRVLYFLEQAGYRPEDIEDETAFAPTTDLPFERAFLTSADASGDSDAVFSREVGGRIRWLVARINELEGIVGAKEEECEVEKGEDRAQTYLQANTYPLATAEVDPSFLLWRLKRALQRNRHGVPPTVAYWRSVIDKADEQAHPALDLPRQSVEPEQLRSLVYEIDAAILWRLELGAATPLLQKLRENLAGGEEKRKASDLIEETRREIVTPEIVSDHGMRLLDLALVLDQNRQSGTGLVMAVYDDLMSRGADSEYARSIMDKTVVTYVETMRKPQQPGIVRT